MSLYWHSRNILSIQYYLAQVLRRSSCTVYWFLSCWSRWLLVLIFLKISSLFPIKIYSIWRLQAVLFSNKASFAIDGLLENMTHSCAFVFCMLDSINVFLFNYFASFYKVVFINISQCISWQNSTFVQHLLNALNTIAHCLFMLI